MDAQSKGPELKYDTGRGEFVASGVVVGFLVPDPRLGRTSVAVYERDALGRKMAAAPELVEAVRRALWHVTGDCNSWLRTAVQEFVAETGQSARDAVGYTNEFHSWCQAREARDAAFLHAALKKAGVEP